MRRHKQKSPGKPKTVTEPSKCMCLQKKIILFVYSVFFQRLHENLFYFFFSPIQNQCNHQQGIDESLLCPMTNQHNKMKPIQMILSIVYQYEKNRFYLIKEIYVFDS